MQRPTSSTSAWPTDNDATPSPAPIARLKTSASAPAQVKWPEVPVWPQQANAAVQKPAASSHQQHQTPARSGPARKRAQYLGVLQSIKIRGEQLLDQIDIEESWNLLQALNERLANADQAERPGLLQQLDAVREKQQGYKNSLAAARTFAADELDRAADLLSGLLSSDTNPDDAPILEPQSSDSNSERSFARASA